MVHNLLNLHNICHIYKLVDWNMENPSMVTSKLIASPTSTKSLSCDIQNVWPYHKINVPGSPPTFFVNINTFWCFRFVFWNIDAVFFLRVQANHLMLSIRPLNQVLKKSIIKHFISTVFWTTFWIILSNVCICKSIWIVMAIYRSFCLRMASCSMATCKST